MVENLIQPLLSEEMGFAGPGQVSLGFASFVCRVLMMAAASSSVICDLPSEHVSCETLK